MSNHDRSLAALALLLLLALLLWALFHTAAQCHLAGGTTVRGLFWLECVQ